MFGLLTKAQEAVSLENYLVLVLSLFLFACGSGSLDPDSAPGKTSVAVSMQAPVNSVRSNQSELLKVEVYIDGLLNTLSPDSNSNDWTGRFTLPNDRSVPLEIRWTHNDLLLATYNTNVGPITELTTLELTADDYVTTGEGFNPDGDNLSNLQELRRGTNPLDANNIDIEIPWVDTQPGINGRTGIIWAENIVTDWRGDQPNIDNLMIDIGATRSDNSAEFYWQAIHHNGWLYIIVYAENIDTAVPFGDSTNPNRDDSLNIFIDGNNSKLTSYDGIDDFHISIPLLELRTTANSALANDVFVSFNGDLRFDSDGFIATGDTENSLVYVDAAAPQYNSNLEQGGRAFVGNSSVALPPSIVYANGSPDQGQQVYEIGLRLDEIGVQIGVPFGIEIQLDIDNDGGDRDARYGWRHPSKTAGQSDVNNTIVNPSLMGTAILR